MNLVRATLQVGQHRVTRSSTSTSARRASPTPRRTMGITTKLDGYPAEGLGGLKRGVSPLEMANAYATLASGGIRNKPIAILRVKFPDGDVEDLGKPKRERVLSDAGRLRGHEDPEAERAAGNRHARATSAARRPARPARPTTSTTPGSTATRRTSPSAVWVGYPDALREMRSVHGISVAGGTFPAEIWNKFMEVAKGDELRRLPAAEEHDPAGRRSSASTRKGGDRLRRTAADRRATGTPPAAATRATIRASTTSPTGAPPSMTAARRHPDDGRAAAPAEAEAASSAAPAAGLARGGARVPGRSPTSRWRSLWAAPGSRRRAGHRRRVAATGCSARSSRSAPAFADGGLAGPLFYAGLWVAMLAYCGRAACARAASGRALVVGAIVGCARRCSLLAPPLLSQDVFSYIAYARLDVRARPQPVHAQPRRRARRRRCSPSPARRTSPASTGRCSRWLTLPLAKMSVPFAFWTLKAVAALASLGDRGARVAVRPAPGPRPAAARAGRRPQPAGAGARRRRRAQRRAHGAALDGRRRRAARGAPAARGARRRARRPRPAR